jgi:hypothetical protein
MADVDAAPPPPELVPKEQPPTVESASAEQVEPAAGEVDLKRKLEEVEPGTDANGTGEDAKRPRVDGEPDGAGESLAHFAYPSPNLRLSHRIRLGFSCTVCRSIQLT